MSSKHLPRANTHAKQQTCHKKHINVHIRLIKAFKLNKFKQRTQKQRANKLRRFKANEH